MCNSVDRQERRKPDRLQGHVLGMFALVALPYGIVENFENWAKTFVSAEREVGVAMRRSCANYGDRCLKGLKTTTGKWSKSRSLRVATASP